MKRVHLSRKLVLEAPERMPDSAGGFVQSWEPQGVVWAQMSARTGRTRDGGDVSLASVGYRVVVRGAARGTPSRPEPGMRFREGLRIFSIQAVAEHEPSGRYLTCFAREEVSI